MSLEEQRRARFEKWIIDNHCGEEDLVLRDSEGEYYSVGVAERWEMYNAALDSVVIELPGSFMPGEAQHPCIEVPDIIEAIEAAGLKVTP